MGKVIIMRETAVYAQSQLKKSDTMHPFEQGKLKRFIDDFNGGKIVDLFNDQRCIYSVLNEVV